MFLLQTSIKIWDLESKSVVDDLRPEFSKTYGRKAIEPYCVSLAWSADGGTLFAGEFSTLGMEFGLEMWVWGGVRCGGHILVGMERRRCHTVRWWVLAVVAGALIGRWCGAVDLSSPTSCIAQVLQLHLCARGCICSALAAMDALIADPIGC